MTVKFPEPDARPALEDDITDALEPAASEEVPPPIVIVKRPIPAVIEELQVDTVLALFKNVLMMSMQQKGDVPFPPLVDIVEGALTHTLDAESTLYEELSAVKILMDCDCETASGLETLEAATSKTSDFDNRVMRLMVAWPAGAEIVSKATIMVATEKEVLDAIKAIKTQRDRADKLPIPTVSNFSESGLSISRPWVEEYAKLVEIKNKSPKELETHPESGASLDHIAHLLTQVRQAIVKYQNQQYRVQVSQALLACSSFLELHLEETADVGDTPAVVALKTPAADKPPVAIDAEAEQCEILVRRVDVCKDFVRGESGAMLKSLGESSAEYTDFTAAAQNRDSFLAGFSFLPKLITRGVTIMHIKKEKAKDDALLSVLDCADLAKVKTTMELVDDKKISLDDGLALLGIEDIAETAFNLELKMNWRRLKRFVATTITQYVDAKLSSIAHGIASLHASGSFFKYIVADDAPLKCKDMLGAPVRDFLAKAPMPKVKGLEGSSLAFLDLQMTAFANVEMIKKFYVHQDDGTVAFLGAAADCAGAESIPGEALVLLPTIALVRKGRGYCARAQKAQLHGLQTGTVSRGSYYDFILKTITSYTLEIRAWSLPLTKYLDRRPPP